MADFALSSVEKVVDAIGMEFGLSDANGNSNLHESIVSEFIRKSVCDLSFRDDKVQPVHTRAIIGSVQEQLGNVPIFHATEGFDVSDLVDSSSDENVQRNYVRYMLSKLASIGDLHGIKGGYWLPCQTKGVLFPGNEVSFIVGGAFTPSIRETYGIEIDNSKCLRTSGINGIKKLVAEGRLKSQSFSDWISIPEERVDLWLLRMIKVYSKKMGSPFFDGKEVSVYLPGHENWDLQSKRWVNYDQKVAIEKGTYLVRCLIKFPFFEYSLAEIEIYKGGKMSIKAAAAIQRKHYRRMMYGFDKMFGRPTKIQVITGISLARVILRNVLPVEETRLLDALGTVKNDSLHHFPREYTLKMKYLEVLRDVFSRVGIA
jgi:hypothetical protein